MSEIEGLWAELAQARGELVQAAVSGVVPGRRALASLEAWAAEMTALPEGAVSAERMANAWGQLQLLLVEGGTEGEPGAPETAWRRVRHSVVEGLQVLLARPEWSSLALDFRDDVLPHLTDAVNRDYAGRIIRCSEAIHHLRWLMLRTSGMPHIWRLRRVADMQYPWFTPDGWYGRMGIDFTWTRAHAVLQALLEALPIGEDGAPLPLVVGFDGRIHAQELATLAAELAVLLGRPVHLCRRASPTPALRHYCRQTFGTPTPASLLNCSASRLPLKDDGGSRYAGHEYQGLQVTLPAGDPASARLCRQISRRAAEYLLQPAAAVTPPPASSVTLFDPHLGYERRLVAEMSFTPLVGDDREETAGEVVASYWRQAGALIVIDELYGAARGYLGGVCAGLLLPHEVMHGEADVLFGELSAANPAPPNIGDLLERVKERREQPGPLIGFALDADGDRLGVVDERGHLLPGNALLVMLADYLLREGYPGQPGLVLRSRTATRALDRLVQREELAGHTLLPAQAAELPAYMRQPGYLQIIGDPHLLHGAGVTVTAGKMGAPPDLLIGGDGEGGLAFPGRGGRDGMRAALLLLQLCAVRKSNVSDIWDQLQQQLGPTHTDTLKLYAPLSAGRTLIDRYIQRYQHAGTTQLALTEYLLGGCTVEFAGGVPEQFLEFALRDTDGMPAYLSITLRQIEGMVRVDAEAGSAEIVQRLLITVAERLDGLLKERLQHAGNPWQVMELLANITSPLILKAELPGTLTCRLAEEAYSRLQELARPGREAPELMRFITECLRELRPENARALAACHLGEPAAETKPPPVPRVHWENEE